MKLLKIMSVVLIAATLSMSAMAQNQAKQTRNAKHAAQQKEHICNPLCNAAEHNYVHGEKGHKCTTECKKTSTATTKKA